MSMIRRKLKSKAGVSMVIALIFLLLCAMVGVLVLSAASVSAGKLSRERQYYRQTLALTSAARLLSEQVQKMTFTGSYAQIETVTTTVTEDEAGDPSTNVETKYSYAKELPQFSSVDFLAGLGEKLDILFQSQNPAKGEDTLTIPESSKILFHANEAQNIPQVTGTLELDGDYSIRVVLTCEGNSMTLVFRGQCHDTTQADPPKVVTSDGGKTTVKTTKTIFATTFTWGAPTITEGGDAA